MGSNTSHQQGDYQNKNDSNSIFDDKYNTDISNFDGFCVCLGFFTHQLIKRKKHLGFEKIDDENKDEWISYTSLQTLSFFKRIFKAFCRFNNPKKQDSELEIIEKTSYIKGVEILWNGGLKCLEFLILLYSESENDILETERTFFASNIAEFLNDIISLETFTHFQESKKVDFFGYCIPDEQENVSLVKENQDENFVKLSNKNDDSKNKKKPKIHLSEESLEPIPKISSGIYKINFSLVKDKKDEKIEEIPKEENQNFTKTNLLELNKKIISNIVNILFESKFETKEDEKKILKFQHVVNWFNNNFPTISQVFVALIKIQIIHPLTMTASEIEKKSYKRVCLIADGFNMEISQFWCPSLAWCFKYYFEIHKVGTWKLIYSSKFHGHSINRFVHHTVGYRSQSVLIIRTNNQEIFGAYIDKPWISSNKYFGETDCFLWAISPNVTIKRATNKGNKNFVYFFNNKNSFSGLPVGIGFGGLPENFRLGLNEDLTAGTITSLDSTYENGTIIPSVNFSVNLIEVWGVSSNFAESGLLRERRLREKDAERARKAVTKESTWNQGPDKFIMDIMGKTGHSDDYVSKAD